MITDLFPTYYTHDSSPPTSPSSFWQQQWCSVLIVSENRWYSIMQRAKESVLVLILKRSKQWHRKTIQKSVTISISRFECLKILLVLGRKKSWKGNKDNWESPGWDWYCRGQQGSVGGCMCAWVCACVCVWGGGAPRDRTLRNRFLHLLLPSGAQGLTL